jgi:phosphoserine phosphatase RsbU/P
VLFIWPGAWLPVVPVTAAIGLAYLLVVQFVFTADEMELERQRHQQAQFEQEVAIGRAIQTSLLPSGHLSAGRFEIASRSIPAREVGGDFYNFFPLSEASPPPEAAATPSAPPDPLAIGIVLGDVSGKGVQGAMYMTVTTTLLEAWATRDVAPEAVLAGANTHLYPKIHGLRMFVTVFYGVLDVAAGRLEFASAGQVPPVLAASAGPPRYESCRGTPLGALRDSRYEPQSVVLAPGDTLILASDGFVEARTPAGKVLGYEGFLDMVSRHIGGEPSICLEGMFNDIQRFSGGAEEQDDRTLVVIRHHAAALS